MRIRRGEEERGRSVSDSGECNVIGGTGFIWVLDIGLFDALVKIVGT